MLFFTIFIENAIMNRTQNSSERVETKQKEEMIMKRSISIILAAIMLCVCAIAPAGAKEYADRAGKFDCESLAAAYAAYAAADFLNRYEKAGLKDYWICWALTYLEEAHPECVTYIDEFNTPRAEVSPQLLREAFDAVCSEAPVNYFDAAVSTDLLPLYDAAAEKHTLDWVGAAGYYEVPELAGFTRDGYIFRFYYALREKEYLDESLVPENAENVIEYGGKTYEYVGWEARYVWTGELSDKATEIMLELNEKGVILISQSADVPIPDSLLQIADPDGDVNGDCKLNARDVTALMKFLVGSRPAAFCEYCADYRSDLSVNAKDVIAIMKAVIAG